MALPMSYFLSVFCMLSHYIALCAGADTDAYPYPFITTDAAKATAKKYDYIIVGGGTAGCPLATTLSQHYSVLLLERGGSPYGNPEVENATLFGSPLGETDKYTSIAQSVQTEDGLSIARARVLGGGTALNAGLYSRASWDYIRNMRWDANLVRQSYEWIEKQIAFKPNKLHTWSNIFKSALLEVGILPYNGYTLNHVEGTKIAGSTFDNHARRHISADLFRKANPKNIVVLLHATTSRIISSTSTNGKLKALGVEFVDQKGEVRKVYIDESNPKNEVIVSAGSIGSPQLLLLSGIGPAADLKKLKIRVVKDLPRVGKGIQDNPRATVTLQSPTRLEVSSIQTVAIVNNSNTYIESSSFVQTNASQHTTTYLGSIFEKLAFPKSRGELRLKTKDPRDNPSVRYNYYSYAEDVQRCVNGVRIIAKLLDTKALNKYKYPGGYKFAGPAPPDSKAKDSVLAKFCHDTLNTMWHFHGGCHVGEVLDADYRVFGFSNLRVIDGSTFPDGPGTNPQATTLMLGRYTMVHGNQDYPRALVEGLRMRRVAPSASYTWNTNYYSI